MQLHGSQGFPLHDVLQSTIIEKYYQFCELMNIRISAPFQQLTGTQGARLDIQILGRDKRKGNLSHTRNAALSYRSRCLHNESRYNQSLMQQGRDTYK